MRVKLVRCEICDDWYTPVRDHCPTCGAKKVFGWFDINHQLDGTIVRHYDAGNRMVRLTKAFDARLTYAHEHAQEIATVLFDDRKGN